ncbi:hypothetical protein CR513_42875, partial [Mucuna pruriens]
MSNKKKLEELEVVNLTEECFAVVLKKLPPKLKDPSYFTILCTMGNSHFDKALLLIQLVIVASIDFHLSEL